MFHICVSMGSKQVNGSLHISYSLFQLQKKTTAHLLLLMSIAKKLQHISYFLCQLQNKNKNFVQVSIKPHAKHPKIHDGGTEKSWGPDGLYFLFRMLSFVATFLNSLIVITLFLFQKRKLLKLCRHSDLSLNQTL